LKFKKNRRSEYDLWQKRYWEHTIRDNVDMLRHIEYIHYNPVKHGLVTNPEDWLYSSIHSYVRNKKMPFHLGNELREEVE